MFKLWDKLIHDHWFKILDIRYLMNKDQHQIVKLDVTKVDTCLII